MSGTLSMDQVLIEKLNNILEVNLDKEHFGVKELAIKAGLSRSQLHRKLKSILHKSPSRFIREFRLKKAMSMLQNNEATASEVAYRVGFGSPTYFNTCFNNFYGYPPGEVKYRNSTSIDYQEEKQGSEPIEASIIDTETLPEIKKPLRKNMVWINTLFILLLSVVSYNLYQNYKDQGAGLMDHNDNVEKSIAIMPFKNLSESKEDAYFTMGVTASLQNQLSTINGLKVISGNSMEKYADTKMAPSEITKEIDVTYLLDGSVQKYGDSIKVVIHFINARENHQLTSLVYFEKHRNLFALQSNIAKEVVDQLNIKLTEEELVQLNKKPTDNLKAYNLYLKGRFFWHRRTEEDVNKGINYFNQATKLDSTFALAYAGLADSYYVMPWLIAKNMKEVDSLFNLAQEYAKEAILKDEKSEEGHATLGTILCFKDWNWEAAEKELKHAIQLNPNYATAHQYYAELLEILGRAREARNEINLALDLNPNSFIMTHISARLYYQEGQYENAIIEFNKSKEFDRLNSSAYKYNAYCYTYLKMNKEAMEEYEKGIELDPSLSLELKKGMINSFKDSGLKGALKFHNNVMLNSDQPKRYAFGIASNFGYLGEIEKALEWLDITYKTKKLILVKIKCEHQFKSLRNEPRFLALLEKMNLGDYE